jgi:nicotinamide phosphoribosyltransferase
LVNFLGTDTLAGIQYAMNYYDSGVCGYSVLAAEHSTVTIYGKENEAEAYRTFLALNPDGVVAIVSDSYDLYNAVKNIYGKQLKEQILARSGKLVIRPDSGYPPEVCTKTLELLWDAFGGTTNSRGYRVLNPKVGVIYGDGINREMIGEILKAVTEAGFSTENVVFGMGGALLQQVNRDTCNFAFKCSAGRGDGDWFDVYKDPVTDTGKRSKRGRLDLLRKDDSFVAVREGEKLNGYEPQLVTVFENGELVREWNFDQIRARQQ